MTVEHRVTVRSRTTPASLLNALGIISGALHMEMKELATGLNSFSETPSTSPLSPGLVRMYNAASFCGFWGVASYLGGLSELALGIESKPPLSVDRTEYLERVKTLASGMNALGVHLRDISVGGVASYTALNEQFAKVIRKARPVMLEMSPAEAASLLFMPAPPSLEADATWLAREGASHAALTEALMDFMRSDETTDQDLQQIAATNPYRTLSGLFESVACQSQTVSVEPLASDIRREFGRLLGSLEVGLPAIPLTPDCFIFSRLLYSLACGGEESEKANALRKRYALQRPKAPGQAAISMHDVARKFSAGMVKLRDGYVQSSNSNTPASANKLALAVAAGADRLESVAFSKFAEMLTGLTSKWDAKAEPTFEEWTYGAALVLMLQEVTEHWSAPAAQQEMLGLATVMAKGIEIHPCRTLQASVRVVAIQKACTAMLVEAAELKLGIEGSLRSFGDEELNDAQAARLVHVVTARSTKMLQTISGFAICVGLPRAAGFADRTLATVLRPDVWKLAQDRASVFEDLSRLTLFIARLRPSSLIDIEDEEMGEQHADLNDTVAVTMAEQLVAEPAETEPVLDESGVAAESVVPNVESGWSSVEVDAAPTFEVPDDGGLSAVEGVEAGVVGTSNAAMHGDYVEPVVAHATAELGQNFAPGVAVDPVAEPQTESAEEAPGSGAPAGAGDVVADAGDAEVAEIDEALAEIGAAPAAPAFDGVFGSDDFETMGFPAPAVRAAEVDPQALMSAFLAAGDGFADALDVDDTELMNIMFEESEQCLADIGRCIGAWIIEEEPEPLIGTVAEARRHVHTLKGVARTCGLMKVGAILHAVEDDLELVPDDGMAFRHSLSAYVGAITVVRDSLDSARSLFESGASPAQAVEMVADHAVSPLVEDSTEPALVIATIAELEGPVVEEVTPSVIDQHPASNVDHVEADDAVRDDPIAVEELQVEPVSVAEAVSSASAADTRAAVDFGIEEATVLAAPTDLIEPAPVTLVDVETYEPTPVLALTQAANVHEAPVVAAPVPAPSIPARTDGSVRVPLKLANKVGKASGQVLMASRRSLEVVERTMKNLREVEGNVGRMGPVLRELDIMAAASIPSTSGGASAHGFDALELDRYTALQELVRQLKEAYEDSVAATEALADGLRTVHGAEQERAQLSDELQRESSELMLVSIATQRARLERVVAKACEDSGKSASLVIDARCRVPAAALDKLMPVFEHLLRNAVAHGIESPAQRAAVKKPSAGVITIGVPVAGNQDGNVVKVSVLDDGAGIDHSSVLSVAQRRGLASRSEKYSDASVHEFLFMPGFSTSATVSQLAGRGVGLDVVRSAVAALGGMVSVTSKAGVGTDFSMTLPTDISSMSVVPVVAKGYTCLLPLTLVTRIVPVSSNLDVVLNEVKGTVMIGGVEHELVDLATRVPSGVQSVATRRIRGHLVLMRESDVTKAVLVDSVGAQARMVVRQLGPFVRDIPGMVAGTTLPNGDAGLVVNPLRLQEIESEQAAAGPSVAPRAKHIMVVDDSSTVRMVTTRFLRRLGFDVTAARDGLEALQALARGARPDGFLFDLEMPGMGGFELISEVRRHAEYRETPIVVISSRTAEKHRERARELGATAYLTKPYEDAQLQDVLENLVGLPA